MALTNDDINNICYYVIEHQCQAQCIYYKPGKSTDCQIHKNLLVNKTPTSVANISILLNIYDNDKGYCKSYVFGGKQE